MIIPVDFAQVNLIYTGPDVPTGAENTFGVALVDPGDTPNTVGLKVIARYTTDIAPTSTTGVTLSGVLVKFGPNATGPAALVPASVAGSNTGSQVTPQVSYLVTKNTALGGREGKGRMYVPGIEEGSLTAGGVMSGGVQTALQASWDAFLGHLVDDDIAMNLLHTSATVPTVVDSLSVASQAATQRRRNRR